MKKETTEHLAVRNRMTRTLPSFFIFLGLALLFAPSAFAAEPIGQVIGVVGGANIERAGANEVIAATPGVNVFVDDVLATDHTGRLKVFFDGKMVLQVGSDTRVRLQDVAFDTTARRRRATFQLQAGGLRLLVQHLFDYQTRARVETPAAVVESKATYFVVTYDPAARRSETLVVAGVVGVIGMGAVHERERLLQPGSLLVNTANEELPLPVEADEAARRRLWTATETPDESIMQYRVGGPRHLVDVAALGLSGEGALGADEMPTAQGGEAGAEFDAFRAGWREGGLPQEDLPEHGPPRLKPPLVDHGVNGSVDVVIHFPQLRALRLRQRTRR